METLVHNLCKPHLTKQIAYFQEVVIRIYQPMISPSSGCVFVIVDSSMEKDRLGPNAIISTLLLHYAMRGRR